MLWDMYLAGEFPKMDTFCVYNLKQVYCYRLNDQIYFSILSSMKHGFQLIQK
jgi:hypothetical protein